MPYKNQSKAYIYVSLTVLLWSTVATAFKIALRYHNYIQLLLVANITSLLVFTAIMANSDRFSQLKKTNLPNLGLSAIQGLFNPFVYYLLVFKAYSLLPAQIAQPANFIWPVILMLLSVPLLKQPLNLNGMASLLISFAGVLILSSRGNPGSFQIVEPFGIILALLSSLVWAFFWILNLKDTRDNIIKLFLSSLFSGFYITIMAYVTGNLFTIFSKPLFAAIYVGLFELGITYTFWLKALQLSKSTEKVSCFVYLTPFISLIFIHFILHEKIYYTSLVGLCLIVGGILVGQIKVKKK